MCRRNCRRNRRNRRSRSTPGHGVQKTLLQARCKSVVLHRITCPRRLGCGRRTSAGTDNGTHLFTGLGECSFEKGIVRRVIVIDVVGCWSGERSTRYRGGLGARINVDRTAFSAVSRGFGINVGLALLHFFQWARRKFLHPFDTIVLPGKID